MTREEERERERERENERQGGEREKGSFYTEAAGR